MTHPIHAINAETTPTLGKDRPTLIEDLRSVAAEMAEKWDAGMKAGKLLAHMEGRISKYDPRISRIVAALEAADRSEPSPPAPVGAGRSV